MEDEQTQPIVETIIEKVVDYVESISEVKEIDHKENKTKEIISKLYNI